MCNELIQTRRRRVSTRSLLRTMYGSTTMSLVPCAWMEDFEAMDAAMLEAVLHERDDLMLKGAVGPSDRNLNIIVARLDVLSCCSSGFW